MTKFLDASATDNGDISVTKFLDAPATDNGDISVTKFMDNALESFLH